MESKDKQDVIAVIDKLENEITRLTKLLEEEIPMPMKMNDKKINLSSYNVYGTGYNDSSLNTVSSWFQYKPYYGNWELLKTIAELDVRKAHILNVILQYETDLKARYEENEAIVKHNTIVQDKIKQLMEKIGVKETYSTYEYKTSRSKTKSWESHWAGYRADLTRVAPTYNEYSGYEQNVKRLKDTLETEYSKAKQAIQKAEREEQAKKTVAENVHKLALLRAKYTPEDAMASANDILLTILGKDKYLHLAHFLEANRGDWSDGYWYAKQGLKGFTIETPEDEEIHNCIHAITLYEDVDGRYFRDCEYSYDVLFGKADDVLYKDYLIVTETIDGL